jgi:hypothetical protein
MKTYPNNGLVANVTMRSELHIIAIFTIQMVRFFNESFILQRFPAAGAVEMFRMPIATQGTQE